MEVIVIDVVRFREGFGILGVSEVQCSVLEDEPRVRVVRSSKFQGSLQVKSLYCRHTKIKFHKENFFSKSSLYLLKNNVSSGSVPLKQSFNKIF